MTTRQLFNVACLVFALVAAQVMISVSYGQSTNRSQSPALPIGW